MKIILFIIFLLVLFLIGSVIYYNYQEEKSLSYEMPNGVICRLGYTEWPWIDKTFKYCSDGAIYVNPTSYKIIRQMGN